jgi:hypothetical protein
MHKLQPTHLASPSTYFKRKPCKSDRAKYDIIFNGPLTFSASAQRIGELLRPSRNVISDCDDEDAADDDDGVSRFPASPATIGLSHEDSV